MPALERFDPFLPAVRINPYPLYARLREHDPVHWGTPFDMAQDGAWYISRYADVEGILKSSRFVKNLHTVWDSAALPSVPEEIRFYAEMARHAILLNDPPDHTRLRKLVSQAFTPRVIETLRTPIATIAHTVLAEAANRNQSGELDLMADYAYPVTLHVIATLVGVPDEQRPLLERWARVLLRTLDLAPSLAELRAADQISHEAFAFFQNLIRERRRQERQAQPDDDLLRQLIAAHDREDRLSEDEIIVMCVLLLLAGFDTTVNLIGNGMLALLEQRHAGQLALARQQPEILPTAIEELLRYEPSTQKALRYALDDGELHGKSIRKGQAMILLLASANRDPAVFADPDRLDITRAPNRHLGFGAGIHVCLGAPLARLEGQIAIHTLLHEYPRVALMTEQPEWRGDLVTFRRLARLPVRLN